MSSALLKRLGIDQLSVDEQLELVDEIWNHLAPSVESGDISQSHQDLLRQRIAAHEADPAAGFSWDEVRGELSKIVGDES